MCFLPTALAINRPTIAVAGQRGRSFKHFHMIPVIHRWIVLWLHNHLTRKDSNLSIEVNLSPCVGWLTILALICQMNIYTDSRLSKRPLRPFPWIYCIHLYTKAFQLHADLVQHLQKCGHRDSIKYSRLNGIDHPKMVRVWKIYIQFWVIQLLMKQLKWLTSVIWTLCSSCAVYLAT